MKRKFLPKVLPRLSYANVMATIALFVALGGAAAAAGLAKNSVGPRQLKKGAVTAAKIRKKAVTSGKIAPKAVTAGKLGANAVLPGNLGNGVVGSSKLANGAVIAASIKNGVVTTNKLTNGNVTAQKLADSAVTTPKIADGDVTNAKLSENSVSTVKLTKGAVTPEKLSFPIPTAGTVSNLASGQTLRGVFDVGAGGLKTEAGDVAKGSVSFPLPLANPVTAVTVLKPGEVSAACTGLGTGGATPAAAPGNLCVYLTPTPANLNEAELPKLVEGSNRLGFGISIKAAKAGEAFTAIGQWAVTAP